MELSGWFNGAATLIAGVVAWLVYKKAQRDEMRDAARIIVMDMQGSEAAIHMFRQIGEYKIDVKVLKTNSWEKYRHLFVTKLDSDEFRLIERYFSACEDIQSALNGIQGVHDVGLSEKAKEIQRAMVRLAFQKLGEEKELEYKSQKESAQELLHPDPYWFLPKIFGDQLNAKISNLQSVTATTAGQKLKRIAKLK